MREPKWIPSEIHRFAVVQSLKAGEMLFRREDRPVALYLVESGEIRLSRTDMEGREIILFTAGAGDSLAEASLFSDVYHCDATASRPTVVRLFPKAVLLAALASEPAVAQAFMATLAHQVMTLRARLENRNLRTARERILHHLDLLACGTQRIVPIRGSLKNMASELGLTHESLYRTLSSLEAEGTISRTRSEIRLRVPPM